MVLTKHVEIFHASCLLCTKLMCKSEHYSKVNETCCRARAFDEEFSSLFRSRTHVYLSAWMRKYCLVDAQGCSLGKIPKAK